MANVLFKKGLLAGLPSTYSEGTIYVTTDERAMYLDISNSERIRLGDFIEVANVQALPSSGANASALYYAKYENVLAKWDPAGGENGTGAWIQINPDNYYKVDDFKAAVTAVTGGVKVTHTLTEENERGETQNTYIAPIEYIGGTNVTVARTDADTITISSLNDTVSGPDKHYTPETKSSATISVSDRKVLDTITRDEKGHITGITERNENDLSAVEVNASAVSNNSTTVSTKVTMTSGTNTLGNFKLQGAGSNTISVNGNDNNKTITITGTDAHVTSAANHYTYDADRDGQAVAVPATTDTTSTNAFVTGVTKDAAGHIIGITTKTASIATVKDLDITAETGTDSITKLKITLDHAGVQSADVKVVGEGATSISSGDDTLIITSTDESVKDAAHHYKAKQAVDSSKEIVAGTYSASGGATTSAKATTQVVSGVTIDAAGHVTGITSVGVKDTHANMESMAFTPTKNSGNGWEVTVKDTDNTAAITTYDPTITYGANSDQVAHAVNGTWDIDVYSISETDAKITELIQATGAMVLKGELNSANKNLPTTGVQAGDTYIVTGDVSIAGHECEAGDTFVAKKDGASTNDDWYYVPSGDDKHILDIVESVTAPGVKLVDGNGSVSGPEYGQFTFNNNNSTSNIKVSAIATAGDHGKNVSFTINMEWGSF